MVKIRLKSCQRTFWTIPDQKTWDLPCSNSLPKQICRVLKRVMHDLYMISTSFSIISRHNHSILPTLWCRTSGEHWLHINRVTFAIRFELEVNNENVKSRSKIQLVGRILPHIDLTSYFWGVWIFSTELTTTSCINSLSRKNSWKHTWEIFFDCLHLGGP